MTCSILIILLIIIIFIISCFCIKSSLSANNIHRIPLKRLKSKLKTGDMMFMMDGNNNVTGMYVLYRKRNKIYVLLQKTNGDIKLASMDTVVNNANYNIFILPLLKQLDKIQLETMNKLIGRNYAGLGDTYCILKYQTKQYPFDCPTYIPNILAKAGVINVGADADCLFNADPSCLQQFTENTTYINGGLFDDTAYQIKVLPTV